MTQAQAQAHLEQDRDEHGSRFSLIEDEFLALFVQFPEVATALLSGELAARGLDTNGNWIGFDKAKEQHNNRMDKNSK